VDQESEVGKDDQDRGQYDVKILFERGVGAAHDVE
jgi:hypothetical protein